MVHRTPVRPATLEDAPKPPQVAFTKTKDNLTPVRTLSPSVIPEYPVLVRGAKRGLNVG